MNSMTPYNFPAQAAWLTLTLLVQRKALIHPAGVAFYVWMRGERLVIAFDPSAIELNRVNDDFAHTLSTRLHGRRVLRTNSRGLFLQVGMDIPKAQMPLETRPLDLSNQPTPWHVPVGMTREGPLWVSMLEGDSFLIGGSRGGGKTGEVHAWIQALLHGGQTMVYAWDFKRGAEFGRYVGRENFYFRLDAAAMLNEAQSLLAEREKILTRSGFPNIVAYNEAKKDISMLPPIAFFVDEAADLPQAAKSQLNAMIRVARHAGLYPFIATNQPTVAEMFAKTNLSTRVAFRVPHHNDSVTMLGYKGAESLPDVRGRGLIVWKGKFVEFQSFEVTYPMPSPEAMKLILEQQAEAGSEASAVGSDQSAVISQQSSKEDPKVKQIKDLIAKGESDSAIVREVFRVHGGSSFYKKVAQVKALRDLDSTSSSTSSSTNQPVLSLQAAG